MDKPAKPRIERLRTAKVSSRNRAAVADPGGWTAHRGGGRRAVVHATQGSAIEEARTLAEAEGGRFAIAGADGRFRDAFSIGRDPFAKISAVEGISQSPAARQRAAEFDKRGLSSEQRRAAIVKAHRPAKG